MEDRLQINQTLFLSSSEHACTNLPKQVRFKSCLNHEFGCSSCPNHECAKKGNYDMDGWRYDTIHSYATDLTRIMTHSQIVLHLAQCDFYTMRPHEEGPQAIL
jgi:hypothetical protein